MSDDHLLKKQALLDNTKNQFQIAAILKFFSKGLTHGFGQKLEILSFFVYGQNRP